MYRTKKLGELRIENVGEYVELSNHETLSSSDRKNEQQPMEYFRNRT